MRKKQLIMLTIGIMMLCVSGAEASTSGAFNIFGSDAEALGKANAFTGEADNPSAVHFNPAGMTQLEGSNVSIGVALIKPLVDYTDSSGNEVAMRENKFIIPTVYVTSDLSSDRFTLGVGAKSNFGAGTDWAPDSFSKYIATKTELENIDYLISGAYQVSDNFSVGIGLDVVSSRINLNKNINQQAGADGQAQVKGKDVGVGYNLSTMYRIDENHQIGAVYKSSTSLTFDGEVHLTGLNTAAPNFLQTVFGGSAFTSRAVGKFELPQSVALGYSCQKFEDWIINLDITWMDWSSISRLDFEYPDVTNTTQLSVLNASDLSLDWGSTLSYSLGVEYTYSPDISLRGGYAYNASPIPQNNFNTFLPDADSHNLSAGIGLLVGERIFLDVAYMAIIFEDRTINNSVGSAVGGDLDGEYEKYIHAALLTVSTKF